MDVRKIRAELRAGRSIYDLPLRVTFYARVSTDQDEQINSLENQVQYYTELIQSKPNWRFVPGYIDEGISGGTTKKRDDFNRMIRDAKAGMFDFIITKEISRFSRSTLDSIKYTQELLENNVGVLFQNDNINTLDTDSEFRLVIMAGVAQDEIRKLSERLKFGFRQAIKNGHVLGNDKLYGYDRQKGLCSDHQRGGSGDYPHYFRPLCQPEAGNPEYLQKAHGNGLHQPGGQRLQHPDHSPHSGKSQV